MKEKTKATLFSILAALTGAILGMIIAALFGFSFLYYLSYGYGF